MIAATPVPMVSAKQITAIRTLQNRVGMDDDAYRAFLDSQAGVRSTKLLTAADAVRVIDALKELAGQTQDGAEHGNTRVSPSRVFPTWATRNWAEHGNTRVRCGGGSGAQRRGRGQDLPLAKGAVAGLDTPVGGKLRALWIAGYDLGLVRDRSDRAMLSFLQRQTGVSHVKFLAPEDAHSAIEALKSWLRRGGVGWPADKDADPTALKRAVIDAQWQRLSSLGAVKPLEGETLADGLGRYAFKITWKNGWCFFEDADYGAVQSALGRKLRNTLARVDADGGAA